MVTVIQRRYARLWQALTPESRRDLTGLARLGQHAPMASEDLAEDLDNAAWVAALRSGELIHPAQIYQDWELEGTDEWKPCIARTLLDWIRANHVPQSDRADPG